MKYILITECPYSGALQVLLEHANLIKARQPNAELVFLLPETERPRYGESQKRNEITISKLGTIEYTNLRRKYRYLATDTMTASKKIRQINPDVVISFTRYAGKINRLINLLARSLPYQTVHVPCSLDYVRSSGLTKLAEYSFETILADHADIYVAVGQAEANEMHTKFNVKKDKIYVVPNSIGNPKPYRSRVKSGYVMSSRISKDKNIELSLEAFKKAGLLHELTIYGDGPEFTRLKSAYPEAKWQGNVSREQLLQEFGSYKYYVTASIFESTPFSLLEAMANKLIPIVSNIPGHKDVIVSGVNGYTFNDVDELTELLKIEELKVNYTFTKRLLMTQYSQGVNNYAKILIRLNVRKVNHGNSDPRRRLWNYLLSRNYV